MRASISTSFSGSTASTCALISVEALEPLARSILQKHGITTAGQDPAYFRAALAIVKEKIKLGRELPEWMGYFFTEDFPFDEAAAKKVFTPEGLAQSAASCANG